MHQTIQNMILSWGLELKLNLLWRTTISGQHTLSKRWEKVCEPLFPLEYKRSRGSHIFHFLDPSCYLMHIVITTLNFALLAYFGIQWENSRHPDNFGHHCTNVSFCFHFLPFKFAECHFKSRIFHNWFAKRKDNYMSFASFYTFYFEIRLNPLATHIDFCV